MLKTNLTGELEYLISDLTAVKFDAAWAWGRLKYRYENNRVIVGQHLNKFMTQDTGKWKSKSLKNAVGHYRSNIARSKKFVTTNGTL